MDVQQPFNFALNTTSPVNPIKHILTGSFRSFSLLLLAFSPSNHSLTLLSRTGSLGPHQYLHLNVHRDRVYTTSWGAPIISAWEVEKEGGRVVHIGDVPITAISSYITIPPPHTNVYSMGGPTGEVHVLDPRGGLGRKVQEVLFVPEGELEGADKTRVALRTGSHGIEFSSSLALGFVPVLGTNSIEVYRRDTSGLLQHLYSSPSPRGEGVQDGPRHVKVHPNGKVLYAVTEHSNMLDAYTISPSGALTHLSSVSLIPSHLNPTQFRGDTLMLAPAPSPYAVFCTTRGGSPATRGWMSIVPLDEEGHFMSGEEGVERWQTPTSGGKANAIDLAPKDSELEEGVWIVLTDDEDGTDGAVRVLEWDKREGVRVVASWKGQKGEGASHAVWLD